MIYDVFLEQQNALVPCQGSFNGFHETIVAVSKTCLVNFERNRYSVSVLVVLYQHLHPPAARTYGKCWNHKNH